MINETTLAPEINEDRKGNWIRTYSGGKYYPLDPRVEDINIEDIAHSISMLCRYNGHVNKFYSVAEHCWILSYHVPEEFALEALLHDASEAYLSDIPRPLKYANELKAFREIEEMNVRFINKKFLGSSQKTSEIVDEFDKRIVTDEKRLLMNNVPEGEGLEPLGLISIDGYRPDLMKKIYLERFRELTGE